MAINNVNEFLRKTFSKTIFGTPALRPIAVCADGFNLSIQASSMHYCRPNEDLSDGNYSKVELSYLSEEVEEFLPFADDNESQRIAKSVCAYCSRELNDRKNMTITIGTGDDNGISVKVSCDTLLHYEPTSKEVFVNVKSASKNEREKINQYVKDNGTFVSEDLVPMSLLQSVVSYGWEHWNRDFPE